MVAATLPAGAEDLSRFGARRYARHWAREVARLGFVPVSSAETERVLLVHTLRLARALLAHPFSTEPAYGVGRALVEAHLTEPGVVDWSVRALGEYFVTTVMPGGSAGAPARRPATARLPRQLAGGGGGLVELAGAMEPLAGCAERGDEAESPALRARLAGLQGALAAGYATALRERTFSQQERIARSAWQARDAVEQALRDSEARFRAVFTGAAIGIGIADTDGQIIDVNQAFAGLLGYTAAEMRRINVASLFHADDAAGMWELYQEILAGKLDSVRVEKRYHRKDGSVVWTDLAVSLIRYDDGRPRFTVAMVEDITERYELQQRLRFQALHDPLTGLPNRTLFFDRLAEVIGNGRPTDRLGICFLDLDGFKAINDTLGHHLGDQLLVMIARRLADCVAGKGHLVARMGGDEFVILVGGDTGREEVISVAEAALAAVAEPVQIGDQQLAVSASVGIVDGPIPEVDAAELMKAADSTLYWAKAEGRGRWALYDPVREARDRTRATLAARLPEALERGEFAVDYQPIVALDDGTMLAVEALVRWHHPRLGLLGPDEFIGLAEETGLINRLGRWVLERACLDAAGWRRAHPHSPVVVSVNLAARQASDPGIVAAVAEVLDRSGLPARLLQLELTESAVMATTGEPVRSLRRLADLGVRLAIDDFGTGYSNLAYLRRLPIHALKLAGPFIEGLREGLRSAPELGERTREMAVDERIVDALVRLAHALGLSVTAEAVETRAQADLLRELGCDSGQGRFFGPPMPEAGISARLCDGGPGWS